MPGKARPGKIRNASGAKKRFSKTGSGKYAMQKVAHNHLLQQKSKRQKRLFHKTLVNPLAETRTIKRVLPSQ